jgi:hypothetical protein
MKTTRLPYLIVTADQPGPRDSYGGAVGTVALVMEKVALDLQAVVRDARERLGLRRMMPAHRAMRRR